MVILDTALNNLLEFNNTFARHIHKQKHRVSLIEQIVEQMDWIWENVQRCIALVTIPEFLLGVLTMPETSCSLCAALNDCVKGRMDRL